jgi:predicted NUDIX family NTP pyrophosphohydrolase
MPRKQAAGLLIFRRVVGALEVLLVHPGGPLWARKDDGAWSIPKGEVEPDEEALAAARREVEEETGARPSGTFIALSPVRQTGGKIVHVWAIESDFDPASLKSNLFEMEWPPKSGNRRSFPK